MLVKHASAAVLEAVRPTKAKTLMKDAHRHDFQYEPREGFLYVRSRAISSRTNDNYDTFPAEELRQAWATFIGKPVFVNHNNEDHRRMRGVNTDAALHDDKGPDGTDDTWIEVLMEIDARTFPLLAQRLIDHDIERTSMGCDVLESECSYCGNVARIPSDYCAHVKRMKGQRLIRQNEKTGKKEEVLVHEICRGLSFFENSLLVEPPADPTAYAFGLDTRGIEALLSEGKLSMARNASMVKKSVNVLVDDMDVLGNVTSNREGVVRQEKDGMALVQFADGDQRMFASADLTWTDQFWGKTASKVGYNGMNPPPDDNDEGPDDDSWIDGEAMFVRPPKRDTQREMWDDMKMGSKTAGDIGAPREVRVPPTVETLRMQECPVCEAEAQWTSDGRCDVCGYLPPPKPFSEPDTEVAGRADDDGGWFNPDLVSTKPFEIDKGESATSAESNPVEQPLSTTKGQKVSHRTPQRENRNMAPSTNPSVAAAARRRKVASASGAPSRPDLAAVNARLAAENAALKARLGGTRKVADEENPAQPVPEPSTEAPVESEEQTIAEPEAQNVDVETPGGVLADPQSAPADVESIGGEAQDEILAGTNQTTDVEAPVSDTTEVDPAAVIDVQPDHRGETLGEPAFTGDWLNPGENNVPDIGGNAATGGTEVEARLRRSVNAKIGRAVGQARDRIWASMRLANLQISAGLANGDMLEVASSIEGSDKSLDVINAESSTLINVARTRPAQAQGQPRRQASRTPSLAGQSQPSIQGLASRTDDEALFE